jgi:hypothetical protein
MIIILDSKNTYTFGKSIAKYFGKRKIKVKKIDIIIFFCNYYYTLL